MESKETRREFLSMMGRLAFTAVTLPVLEKVPQIKLKEVNKDWELFQSEDQVFAMAKGPAELYSQPDDDAPRVTNKVINTYEANKILYSPRHMIEEGTMLRVKKTDGSWARILKQDDIYSPFIYPDTSGREPRELYIRLEDFNPILQLEPVTMLECTKPHDKEIIIIRWPSPQLFLVEQDQVLAHIPVVLGSYDTPTPNGDFHVSVAKISTHMPSFPGVAFNLEIVETTGIFIHMAPWWIWPNLEKGRYGSHGCINLPDGRWKNASVKGEGMSMAQFIFRWALTNLPLYDQKKTEYVKVRPKDPFADKLLTVHIMNAIEALKWVKRANPNRDWKGILSTVKSMGETDWIIPRV